MCLALLLTAATAMMVSLPLAAAGPLPTAIDVIFEHEHTKALAGGTQLNYRFQRTVSDERLLGAAYSDDIKVDIKGELAAGNREVGIAIFTGERGRQFSYPDLTINPIINFYLDHALKSFSQIAGGDTLYLKGLFKAALRDKASVEQVDVDYLGGKVTGYRVAVTPFAGDGMAYRMQGYEGSTFALTLSDKVPGHVVELVSTFSSTMKEAPRLDERITFTGTGASK